MSNTALSDIQEVIERSLFERIRTELVDKGYLPDVTQYPDTDGGVALWESDIATIKTNKGFAIEVFNENANYDNGVKKIPRIVLASGNFLQGSLGGDPGKIMQLNENNDFIALRTPPQTSDFFIDIRLVSNSVEQERILNAILSLALPKRGYIATYNDPEKLFFIRYISFYNQDDLDKGIIEKVLVYTVEDCWETEDIIISTDVAKITRIDLNINLQKYMDGNWGSDADKLMLYSGLSVNILDTTIVNINN